MSLSLSLAAAPFISLTLYALLTIWCSGQTALFLSLLAKAALAYLSTALSLCGTEPIFFLSAGAVCSSFSAKVCTILHALCWSRQYQQVCHFSSLLLLSGFCSALAPLSSPPSFLLPQSLRKIWGKLSSFSSCSIRHGSWDTCFFRGTTRLMSWPDGEHYSCPLQSLVVSFFLSLVSTLLFSRTGGVLSHQSSLIHRFPQFLPRNLRFYATLAVFSLVFAATDTAFC